MTAGCDCRCCEACADPVASPDPAELVPQDDVLRAQIEHEAAIRARLVARVAVRVLDTPERHAAYEEAVLVEGRRLRELHDAIAREMGVVLP